MALIKHEHTCKVVNTVQGEKAVSQETTTSHKERKNIKTTASEQQSKKISNDQELIQSDPTSCPQNQKGNK